MKLSTDRILTTHVGSLPRPADLLTMVEAREAAHGFDDAAFAARLRVRAAKAAARTDTTMDTTEFARLSAS